MPTVDIKILEFNQYQNTDKAPFIIYANLECIIGKNDGCKNNPENWSITKASGHIPSVFQCLWYIHLKKWKISIMYRDFKIVRKSFVNSWESMEWK